MIASPGIATASETRRRACARRFSIARPSRSETTALPWERRRLAPAAHRACVWSGAGVTAVALRRLLGPASGSCAERRRVLGP